MLLSLGKWYLDTFFILNAIFKDLKYVDIAVYEYYLLMLICMFGKY